MIESRLREIYDIPCWFVSQGHGSFITIEFGQPHLEIREPSSTSNIKKLQYRNVKIYGEWHLWIYCCDWEVYLENKLVAHSESSRNKIKNALKYINGQKITKIEIDNDTGDTNFYFDLGGLIKTKHYVDDLYDQWLLYDPYEYVLTICNDGKYSYQHVKTPVEQEVWQKITY